VSDLSPGVETNLAFYETQDALHIRFRNPSCFAI